MICGADTWVDIESYGRAKYEWLKTILELPNGIPTHDTIARVFSRLTPEQFQKCFLSWIQSISCLNPGEVIAVDGKTLRHSYDRGEDKKAIDMVSAWATSQRLVLGQVKVDKKSNEITAIPALLKVLELNGSIVTIDAMGCQRSILKSNCRTRRRLYNHLKKEPTIPVCQSRRVVQASNLNKDFWDLHIQLIRQRKRVITVAQKYDIT